MLVLYYPQQIDSFESLNQTASEVSAIKKLLGLLLSFTLLLSAYTHLATDAPAGGQSQLPPDTPNIGQSQPTPTVEPPQTEAAVEENTSYWAEHFPRIDGSTSLIPLETAIRLKTGQLLEWQQLLVDGWEEQVYFSPDPWSSSQMLPLVKESIPAKIYNIQLTPSEYPLRLWFLSADGKHRRQDICLPVDALKMVDEYRSSH